MLGSFTIHTATTRNRIFLVIPKEEQNRQANIFEAIINTLSEKNVKSFIHFHFTRDKLGLYNVFIDDQNLKISFSNNIKNILSIQCIKYNFFSVGLRSLPCFEHLDVCTAYCYDMITKETKYCREQQENKRVANLYEAGGDLDFNFCSH